MRNNLLCIVSIILLLITISFNVQAAQTFTCVTFNSTTAQAVVKEPFCLTSDNSLFAKSTSLKFDVKRSSDLGFFQFIYTFSEIGSIEITDGKVTMLVNIINPFEEEVERKLKSQIFEILSELREAQSTIDVKSAEIEKQRTELILMSDKNARLQSVIDNNHTIYKPIYLESSAVEKKIREMENWNNVSIIIVTSLLLLTSLAALQYVRHFYSK